VAALHPVSPELLATLVQGAAEIVETSRGLVPWRLPLKHAAFYHPDLIPHVPSTAGVHLLDGLKLTGPGDDSTMPDELHPDANGIRPMAGRFLRHMPQDWREARANLL